MKLYEMILPMLGGFLSTLYTNRPLVNEWYLEVMAGAASAILSRRLRAYLGLVPSLDVRLRSFCA